MRGTSVILIGYSMVSYRTLARRSRHTGSLLVLGASALFLPRVAAAEAPVSSDALAADGTSAPPPLSASACVEAHASAQEQRQNGQLLQSRAQLLACGQEACPALVRADCLRFLDELRAQIPSITFHITVDGESRPMVSAFVDDKPLFVELPTRALEFDPGRYHFRFQYADLPPIERDLTLSEGEKFVSVTVAFESAPKQLRSETTLQLKHKPKPVRKPVGGSAGVRPIPWPVFALGGIGVVGLGSFVGFGLATRAKENELRDTCSPTCSQAQLDSVKSRATMADVSLVVGGVALAAAGTYYFLRPAESIRVGAVVLPSGGVNSHLSIKF